MIINLTLPSGREAAVEFTRKKMKNIRLRLTADGEFKLSAPLRLPEERALSFLREREDWIDQKLAENAGRTGYLQDEEIQDGGTVTVLGIPRTVAVFIGVPESVILKPDRLLVTVKSPDRAAKAAAAWRRRQARAMVGEYIQKWAPVLGVPVPAIVMRRMKTLWGSCSHKKRKVTLNLYLFNAPPECVEYIVLHELAHFVHPNHSPAFHALMGSLMPDWKARKKLLERK